jgi:hypothetical protein
MTRVALLLFAALAAEARAEPLDAALREQVALSVAQVRARDCPEGGRAATAFAYGEAGRFVTALHAVAGCRTVSVFLEKHGGHVLPARVERVVARADLALLTVENSPAPPLRRARAEPAVNDALEAVGYYLAVPTMDNKPLRVTFGDRRLASMLPEAVRRELAQTATIDLEMEVVRLDGHLLPGLSGAPLVDATGAVAAVGSGGLQSGAASVSFGVPATWLDALERSTEAVETAARPMAGLFAASLEAADAAPGAAPTAIETFRCDGLDFVEIGERSFDDLALATDDPVALQQILATGGLGPVQTARFRYRVFAPLEGGAAVAVPDWMTVEADPYDEICRGVDAEGVLSVEFAGTAVGDLYEVQAVSVAFEDAFVARSGRWWEIDPMFSYLQPLTRLDGLIANRKTAVGVDGFGQAALAFETLMTRGPIFTGAIALSQWWDLNAIQYCAYTPADPGCAPVRAHLERTFQTILGVHLSTFPII